MKSLRMLLVEDQSELVAELKNLYRQAFARQGFDSVTIEEAAAVEEARELARAAKGNPYDLVSLDVNLGDQELTGLDVLSALKRFQSTWMVAMLTGVETDRTLDDTLGKNAGENLRKRLRRDAFARFPAERLLVVEKPSTAMPSVESATLLADRVSQIALIYDEVARTRYIFRPIEVMSQERVQAPKGKRVKRKFIDTTTLHWQIRFNCGDIRTLPNRAGFRTLHHLLSLPREESLTPEQALVIEPKNEKTKPSVEPGEDPVAEYFEAQEIPWKELDEAQQNKLIAAALSLRFKRYVELREYEDDDDLSAEEGDELERLIRELGPLGPAAESAYQRMHDERTEEEKARGEPSPLNEGGMGTESGNYERVGGDRKGYDSPAAKSFRARWMRSKKYLRENGFSDLAQHLEDYIQPSRASWSYNPPEGMEWTT
jgi:CheY-like chemotaxis protein